MCCSFESNPLSGTIPDIFYRMRGLTYFSSYGCAMPAGSHLPPSTKMLAAKTFPHLQFYVQDEQLEWLYDHECMDEYRRDKQAHHGGKRNYGTIIINDYDHYGRRYCIERETPMAQLLYENFGPGDRLPNGMLRFGAPPVKQSDEEVAHRKAARTARYERLHNQIRERQEAWLRGKAAAQAAGSQPF